MTDPCRGSIETFLARHVADWRGLPAGCAQADLARWLPFRDGAGRAFLGTDREAYEVRVLAPAGFARELFFHFRAGALELIATEYWSFDPAECDAVVAALGAPDLALDFPWSTGEIARGDHVHAARGIAVAVIPETRVIARLAVFAPCPPGVYRRRYSKADAMRERPDG